MISTSDSRRDPVTGRRIAAALTSILLLAIGCRSVQIVNEPDLARIYNDQAQSSALDRNPVIVIPGLTGSKLVDGESGRLVWGAFAGDYARPDKPEDARLIALPMREGVPLRELRDAVEPAGVLDRLRVSVLGIPINLQAYFHILEALGVGGYRDESLPAADVIEWGDEHFTCFQFDFDWRRDNVENAQRLERFIEEKKEYVRSESLRQFGVDRPDLQFDVVSHSMGGLLLRYYLRFGGADLPDNGSLPEVTWAGAANVARAVLVAPPNAGTLESVSQLVEGKDYGPFVSYSPTLLGTFPSGYQMLPRGRHHMLLQSGEAVKDLFDSEFWVRMGWGLASPKAEEVIAWLLPDESDPQARRRIALEHQRKSLDRARQFTRALDQVATAPPGLRLYLVAGDSMPTPRRMVVPPFVSGEVAGGAASGQQAGGHRLTIVETEPGDGKVLRSSALMDERLDGEWTTSVRSPIHWHNVLFLPHRHLDITKNPVFTDNLLYWLLEEPREIGTR